MKISTKGRYGLRILLDLAMHKSAAPRLLRDIAASQRISEKYISRLIITLRQGGMVSSIRGAKGGFRLAKSPADVTVLDIVEVMEGRLSIVHCVAAPGSCKLSGDCAALAIWDQLNSEFRASMKKITLQDIIEKDQQKRKLAERP